MLNFIWKNFDSAKEFTFRMSVNGRPRWNHTKPYVPSRWVNTEPSVQFRKVHAELTVHAIKVGSYKILVLQNARQETALIRQPIAPFAVQDAFD